MTEAEERNRIQAWDERDIESELRQVSKAHPDVSFVTNYAITCIARTEKEARYWKSLYQIESESKERRNEQFIADAIEIGRLRVREEKLESLENCLHILLARLSEFEASGDVRTEDGEREWSGHVAPSIARLRGLLPQPTEHDA